MIINYEIVHHFRFAAYEVRPRGTMETGEGNLLVIVSSKVA